MWLSSMDEQAPAVGAGHCSNSGCARSCETASLDTESCDAWVVGRDDGGPSTLKGATLRGIANFTTGGML